MIISMKALGESTNVLPEKKDERTEAQIKIDEAKAKRRDKKLRSSIKAMDDMAERRKIQIKSLRLKEVGKLSPILIKILPDMFKAIGLTMTHIKSINPGYGFAFRIKEFNSKISCDFDGFILEFAVRYNGQFIDYISMIGVPWVYRDDFKFYANWTAKDDFGGPYDSIEALMKRYIPNQLRLWIKRMLPETSIHVYESDGCTWAKLINSNCPPHPGEKERYVGELKLWK
ncbi:MAG: hypothetical protein HQM09_22855 [Candidatus Riflebacteria bacterium]|nr:hypothetical protein [Candidatus Riflebacteria bacterium]